MLQKSNLWNVATVFFHEPNKQFELLTISKQISLAHTSVKKHLLTLIDLQIIEKKHAQIGNKNNFYYIANKRHPKFIQYKKIYNGEMIQNSGIINYLEQQTQPNCIVLFGSYQKGEDSEQSDIDLFVESSEVPVDITYYEKILNKKIQLHFKKSFQDYPIELKNNIINGYIVSGYLEAYDA